MVKDSFFLKKVFYDDDAIDAYSDQIIYSNKQIRPYDHPIHLQRIYPEDYKNRHYHKSRLMQEYIPRYDQKNFESERSLPRQIRNPHKNVKYDRGVNRVFLEIDRKQKSSFLPNKKTPNYNVRKEKNLSTKKHRSSYDEAIFEEVPSIKFLNSSKRVGYHSKKYAHHRHPSIDDEIRNSNRIFFDCSDFSKSNIIYRNKSTHQPYYNTEDVIDDRDLLHDRKAGKFSQEFSNSIFLNLPKPPNDDLNTEQALQHSLLMHREDKHNGVDEKFIINRESMREIKSNVDNRTETSNSFENQSRFSNESLSYSRSNRYDINRYDNNDQPTKNGTIQHSIQQEMKNFNKVDEKDYSKNTPYGNENSMFERKSYDERDSEASKINDNKSFASTQMRKVAKYDDSQTENNKENVEDISDHKNENQPNGNTNNIITEQEDNLYSIDSYPYPIYKSKRNVLNNSQNRSETKIVDEEETHNSYNSFIQEKNNSAEPLRSSLIRQHRLDNDSEGKEFLDTISEKSFQNHTLENGRSSENSLIKTEDHMDHSMDYDENISHLRRLYGNESLPYSFSRSDCHSINISPTLIESKEGTKRNKNDSELQLSSSHPETEMKSTDKVSGISRKLSKISMSDKSSVSGKRGLSFSRKTSNLSRGSKNSIFSGNKSRGGKKLKKESSMNSSSMNSSIDKIQSEHGRKFFQ